VQLAQLELLLLSMQTIYGAKQQLLSPACCSWPCYVELLLTFLAIQSAVDDVHVLLRCLLLQWTAL
jgi:hypothetical protein